MPFKPGVSGNPGGRPKQNAFTYDSGWRLAKQVKD